MFDKSHLMMENSRTNEKGKALVSANSSTEANNDSASITSPNTHPPSGLAFLEGNVEEDTFDCLLDMASSPEFEYYTNLQGLSLLPDCNMSLGQQCVNQGHNAISAGGVSTSGGESSFVSFNRPQSQTGIQGNFEASFLSLGIGGIEESVCRSQLGSREVSDKLKEAASNELKMTRARKATGQTFDAGFMGFDRDNSGFSNHFCQQ
ncbi:hypothetical protein L1987_53214 [Smallanthus sonchifolius]|uniref:Uncharacterized protein n=1 Tax=Smallanthus sonchifolius TaxID=185202 RepID=A0ACB9EUM8_9ASTR|nr:hypothetical protein L1987_53214 [Smallanthus sonchifolius]